MADFTLKAEITADASGLVKAAGEAKSALKGVQEQGEQSSKQSASGLESMSKSLEAMSKKSGEYAKIFAPMSLAASGFLAGSVKASSDFNGQMSKVQAISGATAEDMELLSAKARQMGKDTKFSSTEAGQAYEYMAMAGWKAEDMLGGIEGIMNLAAASGEDLGTTSDIVTDALTAFGLTAKDSGHFADILAAASSNSNTNVKLMGETFKYVAPIAGALGYSSEETAEAIGLMANAGIKGSQAGTSLRKIMNSLRGELIFSGKNMEGVTVQTKNADGSMRDFSEILADCRVAFSKMSESEKAANAENIVGQEAMSGFLALMNAAPEDIDKLSGAIENCDGKAADMAETMQDNLQGDLTLLKSSVSELAVQFGDILTPYLREAAQGFKDFVDKIAGLPDGVKKVILVFGLIAAALAPALLGFSLISHAASVVMADLAAVGKAFAGLEFATVAPIMAIVAVIAILVGAFIYLWTTNEDFRNSVIEIWTQVKETFSAFIDAVTEKLAGWGITWESVTTFIKNAWQTLCDFLAPIFIFVFQTIADFFDYATQYILGVMDIFHGLVTRDWTEVWEGVKQIFSAAWDFVLDLFDNVCEMLGLDSEAIKQDISDKFNAVKDFLFGIWENIKDDAKAAWELLKTLVLGPVLILIDLLTGDFDHLKTDLEGIWNNIKENGGKLFGDLKDLVIEIAHNLVEKVQEKIEEVPGIVEDGFQQAIDFITSLPGQAYEWGSDIMSNLVDGIWRGLSWVTDAVSSVADTIRSFLHFSVPDRGPLKDFNSYAPDMIQNLVTGMKNNIPTLRAGVELVADEMTGVIPGTGTAGRYSGGDGGGVHNAWGGVNITVNAAEGQDEEAVADAVMRRMMDLVVLEG